MLNIYTNRFISDKVNCKITDLPMDLQLELQTLKTQMVYIFLVDHYPYASLDNDSLSIFYKGKIVEKHVDELAQPTVQLMNSILLKAANL